MTWLVQSGHFAATFHGALCGGGECHHPGPDYLDVRLALSPGSIIPGSSPSSAQPLVSPTVMRTERDIVLSASTNHRF